MQVKNEIRTGRSVVFNLHVHLVFVTKYRRDVFTDSMLKDLKEIFRNVCLNFGAELAEFNGEHDHVHLLINYPTKISISSLVNSLKGVSSRLIRKKKYPEIQKKLWGNQLWSPSYFAGSCGGSPFQLSNSILRISNDQTKQASPVALISLS
jgi:putative transposase